MASLRRSKVCSQRGEFELHFQRSPQSIKGGRRRNEEFTAKSSEEKIGTGVGILTMALAGALAVQGTRQLVSSLIAIWARILRPVAFWSDWFIAGITIPLALVGVLALAFAWVFLMRGAFRTGKDGFMWLIA